MVGVDDDFREWHLMPGANGISFNEFVSVDDEVVTSQVSDIEEIIDDCTQKGYDCGGEG